MNTVLVALGHGDEGKGAWGEYFADKTGANLSVRFSGGCQGTHYVHHNGVVHPASQFSPASLRRPKLETLIAPNVPIHPTALLTEAAEMEELGLTGLSRIKITYDNPIVLPTYAFLRQTRDFFNLDKTGTTGFGISELMRLIREGNEGYVIRVRDFWSRDYGKEKLRLAIRNTLIRAKFLDIPPEALKKGIELYEEKHPFEAVWENYAKFIDGVGEIVGRPRMNRLLRRKNIIFEQAQGFYLDHRFGTKPFVTSLDTTIAPLRDLPLHGETKVIGLTRAFATRHGPGPLPTMTDELKPIDDNPENEFQGKPRYGWLDLPALAYAVETTERLLGRPLDALAVSHLDTLATMPKFAVYEGGKPSSNRYGRSGDEESGYVWLDNMPDLLRLIERTTGVAVRYISTGPSIDDRTEIDL